MPMRKMNGPSARSARSEALRFVARRDYGYAELVRRLQRQGYEESEAAEAASSLAASGLLDDDRVARRAVERVLASGKGLVAAEHWLLRHGFEREQVRTLLADEDLRAAELVACRAALAKLSGPVGEGGARAARARAAQRLARRGFREPCIERMAADHAD